MPDTNNQNMIEQMKCLEEQVKRLKLVQYLTGAMNSTTNYHEMLTIMLDQCLSLTHSTSGSIMSKVENSKILKFEVFRNIEDEIIQETIITIGEGITGLVVQEGTPKLVNDVTLEPKYIIVKQDVKSEMVVPLIINGEVIGVISVDSNRKNAYSEQDLELVQTISNQAAQIISRNNLYQELERKIKLKDILIDMADAIENVMELKEAFDIAMKLMSESFNIFRGELVLFQDNESRALSVFTAYNLLPEEMSRGIYKVGEGITGKVVESGKPISIPDINKDEQFLDRMQIKRNKNIPTSFIAAPIKIDGVVSGVLAVEKPFENSEVLEDDEDTVLLIAKVISNKVKIYQQMEQEKEILVQENTQLRNELFQNYQFSHIIGKSRKMRDLFELIRMVADSSTSILLIGESGTGKELFARSIHYNSRRKDKPFISINCAAIPENLLESELFGFKKGAFTGANSDRKGKFQLANKGTLFLDEIGDMPLYLQAKLLRAIQEKEIEPVGSEEKVKVDIRIVSATNKDLTKMIEDGTFRNDLYYRLNVIEMRIPPLKERKDDIPLLISYFIKKYAEINERNVDRVSAEALRVLQSYAWPGNVRELENVIERSVLLCRSKFIEVQNLPAFLVENDNFEVNDMNIGKWIDKQIKHEGNYGKIYNQVISYIEKELISKSLLHNKRNKVKTSEFLGINRNTLRSKMTDYDINI